MPAESLSESSVKKAFDTARLVKQVNTATLTLFEAHVASSEALPLS